MSLDMRPGQVASISSVQFQIFEEVYRALYCFQDEENNSYLVWEKYFSRAVQNHIADAGSSLLDVYKNVFVFLAYKLTFVNLNVVTNRSVSSQLLV